MASARRWRDLARGVLLILVVGVLLLYTPFPMLPASVLSYRQTLVVFGVVAALGKLLYDTFFYDHYWP